MPSKSYFYGFKVPLHDVDAAGVMFFGHLFRHAHDAYEAFMAANDLPLEQIIQEDEWLLPLVRAESEFRAPLRHGESIRIRLCVADLGRSSFTLLYRFEDETGQIRADARTVHVNVDAARGSSAALPKRLATVLETYVCDPRSSDPGR